ncbi:MAG: hypothetical protein WAM68_02055 [Acidobacteriaceae bacterium]
MRSGNWKIVPVLSGLVLATMVGPYAHAGCGQYSPAPHGASWQPQIGSARLVPAGFIIDDDDATSKEPSIVGTWKQYLISEGSQGIPDGTEVDASYAQWHSDGTEMQVSGMRTPPSGEVCVGVWVKTGARTYRLNHFGSSYDSTGQILIGPARLQAWVTLDAKGDSTSGTFTIDQWDEAGNLLAHLQGKMRGTRVTMDTGFQSVE